MSGWRRSTTPRRCRKAPQDEGAWQGARDDRNSGCAVSGDACQGRCADPAGRLIYLRKLVRADVERWRAIDPSPTIDQAINGGFPWLEIQCFHGARLPNDVDSQPSSTRRLPWCTISQAVCAAASAPIQDGACRRPCSSLPGSRATPEQRSRLRLQQESSTVVHSDNEWTPRVQTATTYLEILNPEQRRAVEHGAAGGLAAPPLLVIAGAGSGKTNTLAHRVAHLIVQGADPRRILLMTFSRWPPPR
ncbi:hypothetical protein V1286_001188 [Bradyrhizobium algeriense]|uniref:UvrD-like helicase ATP-binding domain-containing protein n=1 Tax=Bradyrhizobium algeriense TaxID=634784 RepID=A0ABU8B612_9BRAD